MFQQDVVINVRILMSKGMEKVRDTFKQIDKFSTKSKLSVMFFGMAMERAFKGLTSASMDMMGVFDVLGSFLGIIFLPIAEWMLNLIFWLWDAWDALPQPIKDFIIALVAVVGAIGGLLAAFGIIGLGISGLSTLISSELLFSFLSIIGTIASV